MTRQTSEAPNLQGEILWTPPPRFRSRTQVARFMNWLLEAKGMEFADYESLWRWSTEDISGFWRSIWEYFDLGELSNDQTILAGDSIENAIWFPSKPTNYATRALDPQHTGTAIISISQTREPVELTYDDLRMKVAQARSGLIRLGVSRGDRVVGYLPNIAETVVCFLATVSLGAIWSVCSPDFGTTGAIRRFQQLKPKVLFYVDGYRHGNKLVDRRKEIEAVRAQLPSLSASICVPYLDRSPIKGTTPWDSFLVEDAHLAVEPVSFNHPLHILFSSGTTGKPKPIVHGHGGILVEHLKALAFHLDLDRTSTFFWYTTTGWMMWNFMTSGLLLGSTIVCFDGDPHFPDQLALWRLVETLNVSYFGAGAPYFHSCTERGLVPGASLKFSSLQAVGSTGAPLSANDACWIHNTLGVDVPITSISGGTDVCSAFVGGSPLLAERAGIIACRYLGAKVEAFDDAGKPVIGTKGELVLTAPLPSMPLGFWADNDGSQYHAAYFDRFPDVWSHGDWIEIGFDGSCVITGRSDATLNRGGVRLGTSEFYEVVEALPDVLDSLVVHIEDTHGGAGTLILFVVMTPETDFTDESRATIAASLRNALSPRHVPDSIEAVPVIPRTLSGKKVELPIKRILKGADVAGVISTESLADPSSLEPFIAYARGR
jgi:acetoacetyl-CoA synthetase